MARAEVGLNVSFPSRTKECEWLKDPSPRSPRRLRGRAGEGEGGADHGLEGHDQEKQHRQARVLGRDVAHVVQAWPG